MSKAPLEPQSDNPLVGRHFLVWGPDDDFLCSGQVIDELAPGIFLIDHVDFDAPNQSLFQSVVPLTSMVTDDPTRECVVGTWSFYETRQEAMRAFWVHTNNLDKLDFPPRESPQ